MGKKKDKDRRPKEQRSSYLNRIIDQYGEGKVGDKKKIEPIKCENADDPVQGCGVVGCSICMPASGAGGGNYTFTRRGGFLAPSVEEIRRAFEMNIMDSFGLPRSMLFGIDPAKPDSPGDQLRQQLEAAERAAREPVKQFILATEHKVSWHDVVGNEEAHKAMIEAIEFPIKHAELFKHYGKKPTKGILLKGPPGCGKTMLGKAAAGVIAQLSGSKTSAILSVKATELQTPYIGQTEKLIRQMFEYAKAYKALHGHQLVIFIDEADAILPARSGGPRRVYAWEESNVATFLSEMDGMEESGALVILATNRPEAIDTALLRDGRIDRKITVQRPTPESARIIFERAFRIVPVQDRVMAEQTRRISLDPHRDYLVDLAMNLFFDPTRHLLKVKHEKGVDYLTLGAVVSGAMMVGLVERIKASAFHRDIEAGKLTGIGEEDVVAAIEALTLEQREQLDMYALSELAQRVNAPMLEIDRVRQPEIKYTGTLQ